MNIVNNIKAAANTVASTVKNSAPVQGTKRFVRNVRIEYAAQQVLAAQRSVDKEQAKFDAMTKEDQLLYTLDTAEILRRASQLRRGK
jgi:hypothetical protein